MALNSESFRIAAATLPSPSRLAIATSCSVSGEQASANGLGEVGSIGVAAVIGGRVPGQAGIARLVGFVDIGRTPAVTGGAGARINQQDKRDKSRSHVMTQQLRPSQGPPQRPGLSAGAFSLLLRKRSTASRDERRLRLPDRKVMVNKLFRPRKDDNRNSHKAETEVRLAFMTWPRWALPIRPACGEKAVQRPATPAKGLRAAQVVIWQIARRRLVVVIAFAVANRVRFHSKHFAHRAISALYRLRKC